MLERLFKEVKRRTRVVGALPNERSAATLMTEIALRSSEEWSLKRYLTMDALEVAKKPKPTTFETLTYEILLEFLDAHEGIENAPASELADTRDLDLELPGVPVHVHLTGFVRRR